MCVHGFVQLKQLWFSFCSVVGQTVTIWFIRRVIITSRPLEVSAIAELDAHLATLESQKAELERHRREVLGGGEVSPTSTQGKAPPVKSLSFGGVSPVDDDDEINRTILSAQGPRGPIDFDRSTDSLLQTMLSDTRQTSKELSSLSSQVDFLTQEVRESKRSTIELHEEFRSSSKRSAGAAGSPGGTYEMSFLDERSPSQYSRGLDSRPDSIAPMSSVLLERESTDCE